MENRMSQVEEAILASIAAGATRLPSQRVLARQFGTHERVVARAARALRDRGLLEYTQGGYMHAAPTGTRGSDLLPLVPVPTRETLADHIRTGIEGGRYSVGTPLPKRYVFAREFHMSDHTVSRVYQGLVTEGFLHKEGRRFIVGAEPKRLAGAQVAPPAIAIVQPRSNEWATLDNSRTASFVTTFLHETQSCNVEPVDMTVRRGGDSNAHVLAHNATELREHIAALGQRYRGCLVIGRDDQYDDPQGIMNALASLGMPVVRFTSREEDLGDGPPRRGVYHCTDLRDRFTDRALLFLHEHGHRHVAWLGTGETDWEKTRERRLRQLARSLSPPVRIQSVDELWGSAHQQTPGDGTSDPPCRRAALRAIAEAGSAGSHASTVGLRHSLGWPLCDIVPALLCPTVTGLIASRDFAAVRIHGAITGRLGLSVPGDVSLISYDNATDTSLLPVTTVDRGFGNLAYRAFHLILNDLPLTKAARPLILAEPRIVHRGSVATVNES